MPNALRSIVALYSKIARELGRKSPTVGSPCVSILWRVHSGVLVLRAYKTESTTRIRQQHLKGSNFFIIAPSNFHTTMT